MRKKLGTVRRYTAWLLTAVILCGIIVPAADSSASTEHDWEMEYSIGTDEGIPLADEDGTQRLHVRAGDDVTFDMTLTEGRNVTRKRFKDTFRLYIPDEIYGVMTDDGRVFEEGWLDSSVTEGDYLLETCDLNEENASASNATGSSASTSNAGQRKASASNPHGDYQTLVFRFVEELRTAANPTETVVAETTGSLSFAAPRDMTLVVTREGNDCRIQVEDYPQAEILMNRPVAEANLLLSIRESSGRYKDRVVWKPDYHNSSQVITLLVNYNIERRSESYKPGELKITLDSLFGKLSEATRLSSAGTAGNFKPKFTIASQDFVYDPASDDSEVMVFTNAGEADSYDGFFEVQWTIYGTLQPDDFVFQALLSDDTEVSLAESNECILTVEKERRSTIDLTKTAVNAGNSILKGEVHNLPSDYLDYYWIKYVMNYGSADYAELFAGYRLVDQFPSECLVLDGTFTRVSNDYQEESTIRTAGQSGVVWGDGSNKSVLYVGYPRSKYKENETIKNTAQLSARYEDTDEWTTREAGCEIRLVEFDFEYTGELYSLEKTSQGGTISVYEVQNRVPDSIKDGHNTDGYYRIKATAANKSPDGTMDVEIGDDLLYISRKDGDNTVTSKLQDGEYRFVSVSIPTFYSTTGFDYKGYRYTLEVRRPGRSGFEEYRTGTLPGNGGTVNIKFSRNEDFVAWKLTLHDITDDIGFVQGKSQYVATGVDVFAADAMAGYLHNFCYFKVYHGEVLANPADLENYATFITQEEIAAYDLDTYSTYLQRATYKNRIAESSISQMSMLKSGNLKYDDENNKTDIEWSINAQTTTVLDLQAENQLKNISLYDILPNGVKLNRTSIEYMKLTSNNIGTAKKKLILSDGTVLLTDNEIDEYLQNRTTVLVENNYQGSGRTKISVHLDFSDNPVDWQKTNQEIWSGNKSDTIRWINLKISAEIKDEDVLVYGNTVKNTVYGEAESALEGGIRYLGTVADDGRLDSLAADINQNGDQQEALPYRSASLAIPNPVSSSQAVKKYVRTSGTNEQFLPRGSAGPGEEYTYRLRITNGDNQLGNIVIYDKIETVAGADEAERWYGTLQGIDTSFAKSLNFAPVIYYSDSDNPNPLTTNPDEWEEYDETTEPADIKVIAVDLRYGDTGMPKKLPAKSELYVDIRMKSPDAYQDGTAENEFWTTWTKMDLNGNPVGDDSGMLSNIVQVDLREHVDQDIHLKLFKVDEDKQPVTSDTAVFGLYYDDDSPVLSGTEPLELETGLADGTAVTGFRPDISKLRYDGSSNYYALYLKELQSPDGYFGLGATQTEPSNRYLIKFRVLLQPDGTFAVCAAGENLAYSGLTIGEDGVVEIEAINYRKKETIDIELNKWLYVNGYVSDEQIPGFQFTLELLKDDPEMTGDENAVVYPGTNKVSNTADGNIVFNDITFTRTGVYIFEVREAAGDDPALVYDIEPIRVRVDVPEVRGDGSSGITVSYQKDIQHYGEGNQVFVNRPKAQVILEAEKHYTGADGSGRSLNGGEFHFQTELVSSPGGAEVTSENEAFPDDGMSVANAADASVRFPAVTMDRLGEYIFRITEIQGSEDAIEYDGSVYYAYVNVRIVGAAAKYETSVRYYGPYFPEPDQPSKAIPSDRPLFSNTIRPVLLELEADKQFAGGVLRAGQFTFHARYESGPQALVAIRENGARPLAIDDVLTAVNDGDGKIIFPAIEFAAAGQYTFRIWEQPGAEEHVVYSQTNYRVIVDVELDPVSGYPVKTVQIDADQGRQPVDRISFVNSIQPESAGLSAQKRLIGGTGLKDGQFLFEARFKAASVALKSGDVTYIQTSDTTDGEDLALNLGDRIRAANTTQGLVSFGSFRFSKAGNYIFELTERDGGDSGIEYDTRVFYARVTVNADTDSGKLSTTVAYGTDYDAETCSLTDAVSHPVFENKVKAVHPPLVPVEPFVIRKLSFSSGRPLRGAGFRLSYRLPEGDGTWTVLHENLETTGDDGSVIVPLIDSHWRYEYRLEETRAPEGYSKSRVGIITFRLDRENGGILELSSTGTAGYVSAGDDGHTIIARNHTTGGGPDPGGPDPTRPSPTEPTTQTPSTDPAIPTIPTTPAGPDTNTSKPLLPYIPGDPVPLGKQVITVIDDDGVPRTYLMDVEAPLARTGDDAVSAVSIALMMLISITGLGFLVYLKRRNNKER